MIWGILIEGGEENPWILAGLVASIILAGAVFLREVILNKARQRYLVAERKLDYNLKNIPTRKTRGRKSFRLGVRRNAELITKIKQKSEAAKVL